MTIKSLVKLLLNGKLTVILKLVIKSNLRSKGYADSELVGVQLF